MMSATNTMIAIAATISISVNLFTRNGCFITDPVNNEFVQHFAVFLQFDDEFFQRQLIGEVVVFVGQSLRIFIISHRLIGRIGEKLFGDSAGILVLYSYIFLI